MLHNLNKCRMEEYQFADRGRVITYWTAEQPAALVFDYNSDIHRSG